ncbi:MAG: hypothetical protein F2545_04595 [Actinobacteria bacterium]|nr:hypothetical protein [Actinomycetota bacterium]
MTRVEQIQSQSPDTPAASRRQLIASLIAGGAIVAASPVFARGASAATSDIPKNDERDNPTLNAALERESRMVATYALAVAATTNQDDKAALLLIHDNHVAYVDALRGYLATEAQAPSSQPLASPSGSFSSVASLLSGLEDETATIHTNSIAGLVGINAASLIASIITVEARQSAALALVSGVSPQAAARV